MTHRATSLLILCLLPLLTRADGPADNVPDKVHRIPPIGIKVPDADRAALVEGLRALAADIDKLKALPAAAADAAKPPLWPDVQIYHNAVAYALEFDQYYAPGEVKLARDFLKTGRERAAELLNGRSPWTTATGLTMRGYVSKIDGSVQPYGVELPADFDFAKTHPVHFWFHGRSETLSEINFLSGPNKSPGRPQPADGIVLYPYGRYCTANKFAGEVDAFEALDAVKKLYPVDPDRVVVRGFSMGGAATWHMAVHHASKWAAAQPGAGFAETPEFLRVFQDEVLHPAPWEQKLLHWYDCTDWAENLAGLPLVAYSGEKDKQKQAADIMTIAMKREGLDLKHVVGPGMGHAFDPASKAEVDRLIDAAVAKGRDPLPKKIRFTTYTLRYPQMHWVRVDGLEEHWRRARVEAELDGREIRIKTENVSRVTLSFAKSPLPEGQTFNVTIDGTALQSLPSAGEAKEHMTYFIKTDTGWAQAKWWKDNTSLHKRRYLMGPIDDAFLDHFVMVEPTGKPMNEAVGKWAAAEMEHAAHAWKIHFRGEMPRKKDVDVTDDDLKAGHLILFGDPSSNAVIKKIADKLPIKWTAEGVKVGDKLYGPADHVPVLIYPNPLDDRRYVVINSGFTYREYDYLNNARQIPRLPDWAVIDIRQPVTSQRPGGIVEAGFFDETWQLKK